MAPNVLARVILGDSSLPTTHLTILPALLPNHLRYKVKKADYPGVVPTDRPDARVRGVYVSGLTSFDLKNLDIFEGDQYTRRSVKVTILEEEGNLKGEGHVAGEEATCETYIFTAGQEYLEDQPWSFETFVKEKIWRWADQSEEYDMLNGNAIEDSDDEASDPTGGRAIGGAMDAKLKGKEKVDNGVIEAAV